MSTRMATQSHLATGILAWPAAVILLADTVDALSLPAFSLSDPSQPQIHRRQAQKVKSALIIPVIVVISVALLLLCILGWYFKLRLRQRKPKTTFTTISQMTSRRRRSASGTAYLADLSGAPPRSPLNPLRNGIFSPLISDMNDSLSRQVTAETTTRPRADTSNSQARNPLGEMNQNEVGVDRMSSLRSILTLPAYSIDPTDSEHVLGKEGDRAGIDIVVSHPETFEEYERRRDLEMDSLYRIRQARRAEREARRRQRERERDAQVRGDFDALRALRAARHITLTDTGSQSSSSLISAHQQLTTVLKPKVSAVRYGNVGLARLDGSRVRSDSANSDQDPLLDYQASTVSIPSIAATRRARSGSVTTMGSYVGSESRNSIGSNAVRPPIGVGSSANNSSFPPSSFHQSILKSMPHRRSSSVAGPVLSERSINELPQLSINELPPPPAYDGDLAPTDPTQPLMGGDDAASQPKNVTVNVHLPATSASAAAAADGAPVVPVPQILVTETTSPLSWFPPEELARLGA